MANRIVVLTFEGLATSPLGPYGCSWLETPGLDRLSSSGVVFDRFYACSTDPTVVLQRYLTIEGSPTSAAKLASLLGMPTLFFTDCPAAAELPDVQDFDQCTLVETGEIEALASEVEETSLGRLFAAALSRPELTAEGSYLLWIHSSALVRNWDAPLEFRESDDLVAEDDDDQQGLLSDEVLAALNSLKPPSKDLSDEDDPDSLIAWMAAYGAQVRLIDTLVDVAFGSLGLQPGERLILASTGGFTLGENGKLGVTSHLPKSSRLHLPLLIRAHGMAPLRCLTPVLSNRLSVTLADLIREEASPSTDSLLEEISPDRWADARETTEPIFEITDDLRQSNGAITTYRVSPGWFYISNPDGREELYLKPDDRYDVNDVAKLSPNVIEQFRAWS